jgi:glycosyltransferase involved in cell wall biosynthesis
MSDKLPVYVCSIAKNEAKHVRRWAESAKDADGIFLLDTGSTDDTVAIAKECGVTVFEKTYEKWSFAVARNDLREMLPDHDAWLVNLDLDEVFKPGWRSHWKDIPEDANRLRYRYIWNWKADGVPGVEYHGDKLVRRHSHRWVNKVHEVNQPLVPEVQHFLPDFEIWHFADNTKSRSNYLPLLLEDVEENPDNDRNTYYAARELFFHGRFEEATTLFKRHLTMPQSVWAPERAWSMRYLAKMHKNEAEKWLMRACGEYPQGAEVWMDLCRYYYERNDFLGMNYTAKRALQCQLYKGLYLTEPDAYGWWPRDMAALSSHRLGYDQEALAFRQRGAVDEPARRKTEKEPVLLSQQGVWHHRRDTAQIELVGSADRGGAAAKRRQGKKNRHRYRRARRLLIFLPSC